MLKIRVTLFAVVLLGLIHLNLFAQDSQTFIKERIEDSDLLQESSSDFPIAQDSQTFIKEKIEDSDLPQESSSDFPSFNINLFVGIKNIKYLKLDLATTGIIFNWDINSVISLKSGYLQSTGRSRSSLEVLVPYIDSETYMVEETYVNDTVDPPKTEVRTVIRTRPVTRYRIEPSFQIDIVDKEFSLGGKYYVFQNNKNFKVFIEAGFVNILTSNKTRKPFSQISDTGRGLGLYFDTGIQYTFQDGFNIGCYTSLYSAIFVSGNNKENRERRISGLVLGYSF